MHGGNIVLIIQAITTFMLLGISWFLQVVHYPLYRKIKEGFVQYERAQLGYSAMLVIPLMIVETITAIMLFTMPPKGAIPTLIILNLVVLIVIWIITLLFNVKYHQKLTVRSSNKAIRMLIGASWFRTTFWTLKACFVGAIIFYAIF